MSNKRRKKAMRKRAKDTEMKNTRQEIDFVKTLAEINQFTLERGLGKNLYCRAYVHNNWLMCERLVTTEIKILGFVLRPRKVTKNPWVKLSKDWCTIPNRYPLGESTTIVYL